MNCRKVRLELTDYLNNQLDRQTSAAVHDHLQQCRRCSEEAAFLKNYLRKINKLASKEASADFEVEFRSRLRQTRSYPKASSGLSLPKFFGRPVLAGFVTVIVLFLSVNYFKGSVPEKSAPELSEITLFQVQTPIQDKLDINQEIDSIGESEAATLPANMKAKDKNTLTVTLSIAKTISSLMAASKRTFAAKAEESEILQKTEGHIPPKDPVLELKELITAMKGEIISQSVERGQDQLIEFEIPRLRFEEFVAKLKDMGEVTLEDQQVSPEEASLLQIKLKLLQEK